MTKRTDHTFEFKSAEIAKAASEEATYHEARLSHWQERAEKALVTVKATIGAKVAEHPVTSGPPHLSVEVDYGDATAWAEYQLAFRKAREHSEAADRYRTDEALYATQDRTYELDAEDTHHFRLGGQERPE